MRGSSGFSPLSREISPPLFTCHTSCLGCLHKANQIICRDRPPVKSGTVKRRFFLTLPWGDARIANTLAPSSSGLGHRPFKPAARIRIPLGLLQRACGSVEERFPHTEEAAGSSPATPTTRQVKSCELTVDNFEGSQLRTLNWDRGEWLSWSERLPYTQEAAGSNPASPTSHSRSVAIGYGASATSATAGGVR